MLETSNLTRAIDLNVGDELLLAHGATITVRSVDSPATNGAQRADVTLGYFANGTRQTMHLPADLEVKVRSITAAVINPLIERLEGMTGNDVPTVLPDLDAALDEMRATVLVEAKHSFNRIEHLTPADCIVLAALDAAIARRRA